LKYSTTWINRKITNDNKMTPGKTTIFRQLIFNIVIPTLLALLVFAILNFQHTNALINKNNEEKNRLLANEVTKVLKFQDIAINLIDGEFNSRLKDLSSKLVNKYFANTDKIKEMDLRAIADEIGMDPVNEDIYVISGDGIIINTTLNQDLGMNLYSLGENFRKYLQDIQKSGLFVTDLFAIEHKTKRPKKFTYQPTKDGKYIIELGVYSKQVDDVIKAIEETKSELKSETEGIVDVELFLQADEPFSMNKAASFLDNQKENLIRSFQDKDTISITERVGNKWLNYNYIYMERYSSKERPNSNLYKGSVIRIISDRTSQKALIRVEATRFILIFIITLLIVSVLIYRKTRVITLPIIKLVDNVDRITNGNLRERAEVTGNNEITRLSEKFNMMIAQLESYYYELEEKVKERTKKIEKQKEEISNQRDALAGKNTQLNEAYLEIEEQKKHIMDSIYYARRIQTAILPSNSLLDSKFENYFIFYLPKDIVSGDFYWMTEIDGLVMIAAVDCTGHGVPGAFMSIVGFNQLNNAVNVKQARKASEILNELNRGVIHTLNENSSETSIKDGMDMTLCVFDFKNGKVDFAGANNPMILIRDNLPLKYKGDRFPIGAYVEDKSQSFTNNEIELKKDDMIYLFSDGYADQFGGPENKKFFTRRFEELLFEIHKKPLEEQKDLLKSTLYDWMGSNGQVDDILVIGIKI
jgi:sigma-B regulation protein RsbU (phosphoserine phosphatase)